MKHKQAKSVLAVVLACLLLVAGALPSLAAAMPKNVILMISDGQGYNTVEATKFYTGNPAVYESFPVQMGASTYSAGEAYPNNNQFHEGEGGYDPAKAWTDFNYVKTGYTDSASAGTALATGVKTYDAAIGKDVFGNDLYNIVQIADDYGKATGVVTSVELSHATPATMVAHNASRNNYAQIALEMYASDLDVIMGTGNPEFDSNGAPATKSTKYVGGDTAWAQLKDPADGVYDDWTLIQTKADFEALANGTFTPATDRLLGVPQVYSTLQYDRNSTKDRDGNGVINFADSYDIMPAQDPNPLNDKDPFIATVPTLEVMTQGALNLLSKDKDGFFLMVEGGAVDWANHGNHMTRMLEEQIDFNASVQAVVDWVEEYSSWKDTLLIITADHECGHLWGPNSNADQKFNPLVDNGPGNLPGYEYNSGSHTNALVPVYAKGKGAMNLNFFADQTDPVRGKYVDNTEIFRTMVGDTPWKTYEYSYTYLYDNRLMADYVADPVNFSGCDYYTGVMYAPLSKGYFVGQEMNTGKNETGQYGAYIITDMNYKAQSMGKTGRVYVNDYYNSENHTHYAPMKGKSPKGWGFLGSEKGYLIKNWTPLYLFGQAWYEADKL